MREKAVIHLQEVERHYPGLILKSCEGGFATYNGTIAFTANYDNLGLIDDKFKVEIVFPLTGSDIVPTAKETGGRIPRDMDFHVYADGSMCLGAPFEIRRKYKENPSLKAFIENLLIPFLYSFSFKEKHGYMPFGELSHGGKGIAEYYRELFETDSDLAVLELLKIIAEDNYRGHVNCPCNSGERLRDCHGELIREIKDQQTREQFFLDFIYCLKAYVSSGNHVPRWLMTKRLRSYWNKVNQKKEDKVSV